MVIHYTASSVQIAQNKAHHERVVKFIEGLTDRLSTSQNWWTNYEMAHKGFLDTDDHKVICKAILSNIKACDVVIADATNKATFGVGYTVAMALQHQKPVLLIMREDTLGGCFILGLEHPLVSRAFYNNDNIETVIGEFVKKIQRSSRK